MNNLRLRWKDRDEMMNNMDLVERERDELEKTRSEMDELEHMTAKIERPKEEIDKRKGAAMMEVPQLEEREDSNQKQRDEVVFISNTTQTEKKG